MEVKIEVDKFAEALSNLEKSYSRFEKSVEVYIPILERRREAQAEAQVKKVKDLELKKELAVKIDKLYRKLKKLGLFDEVKTH